MSELRLNRDLSLKCKPFCLQHWGMKINIICDFLNIKPGNSGNPKWKSSMQSFIIHVYTCTHSQLQIQMLFVCWGASAWWTPVFSLPQWLDAQKPLGYRPFDNESRRTSWWPNGSHFLPYLSPQVLGPRFYYSSAAPNRAVWYCKTSYPWPFVSFCHNKKTQNRLYRIEALSSDKLWSFTVSYVWLGHM